jgi:hypothetical protein
MPVVYRKRNGSAETGAAVLVVVVCPAFSGEGSITMCLGGKEERRLRVQVRGYGKEKL